MKWKVLAKEDGDIIKTLLANRGLKTKREIDEFLNPPNPLTHSPFDLLINLAQLRNATNRIKKAIANKEPIIVYGDYDADGICASAIMWEALHFLGASVMPFIPLREKEGYGLSPEGIDTILGDEKYNISKKGLIITVDSGIVAHQAIDYAKNKNLDTIVIDHHEKPKKLPKASAIVHTEQLCATGIAFFVANKLTSNRLPLTAGMELAAIATVTDLMPLLGPNRSIVKYGLEQLNKTTRVGLKALLSVAGIGKVGTYEIGFMIGPRLNASGRIENALSALRLLCTKNKSQAEELARLLNSINIDRQKMLEDQTTHAFQLALAQHDSKNSIIILDHESYHQGVIGLIAGKIVERYYLPAIVIAKSDGTSKASARSISGFNIIETIRRTEDILVNAGGHPMAAGFTIETAKIEEFKEKILAIANKKITPEMLERSLRVDCEIDLSLLNLNFYLKLLDFAPLGIGNPEPVFASYAVIESLRTVGRENRHLKLQLKSDSTNGSKLYDGIAFGQGNLVSKLKMGDKVRIAYSVSLDTYQGGSKLQLKIKDFQIIGSSR